METLAEVLDKARATCSPQSDYELSKVLKISRSAVSAWRNGKGAPDTIRCAKLAEITGIPLARVLGIVGEARAISREEKAVWRRLASAAIVALSLLPIVTIAAPNSTTLTAESSMHYAKYARTGLAAAPVVARPCST